MRQSNLTIFKLICIMKSNNLFCLRISTLIIVLIIKEFTAHFSDCFRKKSPKGSLTASKEAASCNELNSYCFEAHLPPQRLLWHLGKLKDDKCTLGYQRGFKDHTRYAKKKNVKI